MVLTWLLSISILTAIFWLPMIGGFVQLILTTLWIFFCAVLLLFSFNVEFMPIILLLLVVGAFIILIVFAFFVLNQHSTINTPINKLSGWFLIGYLILGTKLVIFFSSFDSLNLPQIIFQQQAFETQAFLNLFDLSMNNSYGFMLLIIGFLLFLLTLSVSLLLKNK